MAALSGVTITSASITLPAWGVWWADVELAEPTELDGAVVLEAPGLELHGTVVAAGAHLGRARARIAAGAAAWGRSVARQGYSNDLGVRASTVTLDAATAVGEQLEGWPETRLSAHWVRPAGPASRVLSLVAPQSWHVGDDGVTRYGARTGEDYVGEATVVEVDRALGRVELRADSLVGLRPGATVAPLTEPASDVRIEITPDGMRAVVYASPSASRRVEALRSLVDGLFPALRYAGCYEYRVVTQMDERVNLQPVRAGVGMPDLERVPVRMAPGVRAQHLLGSLVLVTFADCDPSRPCVVAGDAAGTPGWMPIALHLGETPTLGVARQTDTVVAGAFAGTITGGSVRVMAGL